MSAKRVRSNGRAVVTLRPMTKTLTCSLTCPVYNRYSWPLLSEGPTSPWLERLKRRSCADTYTDTTRTVARMLRRQGYHGDTQKCGSCTAANHPTCLIPESLNPKPQIPNPEPQTPNPKPSSPKKKAPESLRSSGAARQLRLHAAEVQRSLGFFWFRALGVPWLRL